MKVIVTIVFALVVFTGNAQLISTDSSVQVVGYWSKNDMQTYNVASRKYKVKGQDTLDVEVTKYQVDVKVVDSTANSYTIEWFYKNFDISGSNKFTQSISSVFKDIKVIVKTNEMGTFQEVVNWKDVRDEVKKAFGLMREQLKGTPNLEPIIKNVEDMFSTKQSIETYAILDILQYYTFHGGKYILHDDTETNLVSNEIPGSPIDVLMTVQLAQLNFEDDNAVIRVWKEFDKKQMTDAAYSMMKNLMKSTNNKLPPREQIPEITCSEYIGSVVHGSSGWITYSLKSRTTSTSDSKTVEEREIEIQ
jgi:hypothetical protein